jgi:glycosyltransferase involved in cell wall biosynthesis
MIPTYHSACYLRQTLESVLIQDPGPERMQIEVVDDCSTLDDPAAVVAEVGRGRVCFIRQAQNVGHTKNFETCLKRARGNVVHLLHGDDAVREGFYAQLEKAFEEQPQIGAAFCRQIFMDEAGHWQAISPLEQTESGILGDWLQRIAVEQRIMTPSIVVRREVYEELGGFDSRLICSEDWEMWVRIAARYPVWYEPEPLAVYRMHSASNTGRHVLSGEDVRYTRMAIELFQSYLPEETAGPLAEAARETYAASALDTASVLLQREEFSGAIAQARQALQLSRSWKITRRTSGLLLRTGMVKARRAILAGRAGSANAAIVPDVTDAHRTSQ